LLDRVPDFQQTTFAILTPLTIPETQRLDALIHEKFFPRRAAPDSFWQTMLKTVQLDGELCLGAAEIQNVIPDRVLAAEFETGKTLATQRPPKFLLLVRLLAAKFAGDLFEAHGGRMLVAGKNSSTAPPTPSAFEASEAKHSLQLHWQTKFYFLCPASGQKDEFTGDSEADETTLEKIKCRS
jgi:hypothetical protein